MLPLSDEMKHVGTSVEFDHTDKPSFLQMSYFGKHESERTLKRVEIFFVVAEELIDDNLVILATDKIESGSKRRYFIAIDSDQITD